MPAACGSGKTTKHLDWCLQLTLRVPLQVHNKGIGEEEDGYTDWSGLSALFSTLFDEINSCKRL